MCFTSHILIQSHGRDEPEIRNGDFEEFLTEVVVHAEGAAHQADIGAEVAPGGILMAAARTQERLLPDDPGPLDLAGQAVGVDDLPVPAHELYGVVAQIFDLDLVGMDVFFRLRLAVLRLVGRLNADFNIIGDQSCHDELDL